MGRDQNIIKKCWTKCTGQSSKEEDSRLVHGKHIELIEPAISLKQRCHEDMLSKPNDTAAAKAYNAAKTKVYRITRSAKDKWYRKKSAEIQQLADKNDRRAFFDAVKEIYGPTHNRESRNCWKEYYNQLLNVRQYSCYATTKQLG